MNKLIFFDTEFCNFSNLKPISIGLIDEIGENSLYLEFNDYNLLDCSDFVLQNIIPILNQTNKYSSLEIANKIDFWIKSFNCEVTFITDYSGDKIILDNLFKLLDKQINVKHLEVYFKQTLLERGLFNAKLYEKHLSSLAQNISYFLEKDKKQIHNSMHDARANQLGWQKTILDILKNN